jgi:hypothetical protein
MPRPPGFSARTAQRSELRPDKAELGGARRIHMPPAARKRFPASVELFCHTLSVGTEIGIVVVFAAIFIALAIRGFSRTE